MTQLSDYILSYFFKKKAKRQETTVSGCVRLEYSDTVVDPVDRARDLWCQWRHLLCEKTKNRHRAGNPPPAYHISGDIWLTAASPTFLLILLTESVVIYIFSSVAPSRIILLKDFCGVRNRLLFVFPMNAQILEHFLHFSLIIRVYAYTEA